MTIAERLRDRAEQLTRSERQLSDVVLQNYPVSGLGTITSLAEAADVSTPTVARLVQKLGFSGFPDFQRSLRAELDEKISSPLTKRERWVDDAPDAHILNRFTKAVIDNIGQSMAKVDPADFDKACSLLSDEKRRVFVVGGRITRTLADYFFLHLQVIRDKVVHIPSNSNAWPHYLLDFEPGDVVVIFDVRRYENSTLRLAEMAGERGVEIVLFSDQWGSPIAQHASVCFTNHIAAPSAWDSNITTMLIAEIVISEVQERNWDTTRPRMEALEEMFDRTRFFRKF
ncbi:MurR/RpiR family transcriptional regulator [Hoeflea prorocentri]|uniref:MurR/RpiR family transcriptional regulator n=1 Tax=Hoeflea prorocentri TaxID=1922333 RepID=A0A9X3UKL8_9HYPH|nr:MurR/RpiR family transcriptional regulator [Hoeflea prorocentri]MCY6382316.1 MurR/RpiR family transcriptional regulator [Hoeflea prorocentri]MDA5400116.1 MurR/RpiR family transcriptional regulator [Hoeflea prorocentri]